MGAPTPAFIPEPFANASSLLNFPIPQSPPASPANAASWHLGFPTDTMQPEVSGGLPPLGPDFNGIMYTITQGLYALQAGQWYLFNSTFESTIAGYDLGALLWMADGTGFWMSIAAANGTNPDNDLSAANWWPAISYGIESVTGLTGGSTTLAPSKSKKPVIELSGTLTSNQTVILPAQVQFWLIVNSTTGAFTTTVKTAAGTGVVIPQGGPSSPSGVWCDGTNIYLSSTPLTVAIAQAATPLTIVERDNLGQGFFTRVSLSSALENPTIGAVLIQSNALDSLSRWMSFANFKSQALNVSGSLTSAAGWWRTNPDNSIEQGGSFAYTSSGSTVNFGFTVPFTTRVLQVLFTSTNGGFTPGWNAAGTTLSTGSANMGGLGGTAQTIYWRAIGV